MRPRVLQVLGRSAGGIARHVALIVEALDGPKIAVDIAAPSDLPLQMPKEPHELAIPDGLWGHRSAVRRLRAIMRDGGYDVVHAHGLRAGIDAARASSGSPVIVTVHNLVRPDVVGRGKALFLRAAEPVAVHGADLVFAVSEDIAHALRRLAPHARSKIEVLYLGVGAASEVTAERAKVRRDWEVPLEAPVVVTVARLAPQKSLHVLLDAVARLPQVYLIVVGEGPLQDELEGRARRLGIDERVRWLGFRADVANHIVAADVFCLSSTWEGIPLAAQEAILLGTPVVATDAGGMSELIEDRVSGRLVRKGRPAELADALQHVLASPEGARRYAQAARRHVLERFSTEKMLERLERAYREAVTG